MTFSSFKSLPALLVTAALIGVPVAAFSQTATESVPNVDNDPAVTTEGEGSGTAADFSAPEGFMMVEDRSILTPTMLTGIPLHSTGDGIIGDVSDIEVDGSGRVTGIIADIGGFIGTGTQKVRLAVEDVTFYQNADAMTMGVVSMDKDGLRALAPWAPAG